jgi:hypothetical protein
MKQEVAGGQIAHAKNKNVIVTDLDDRSAVPRFNVYVVEANARGDPVNPQRLAMLKVAHHSIGVRAKIEHEGIVAVATNHVLPPTASNQRVVGDAALDIGVIVSADNELRPIGVLGPLVAGVALRSEKRIGLSSAIPTLT